MSAPAKKKTEKVVAKKTPAKAEKPKQPEKPKLSAEETEAEAVMQAEREAIKKYGKGTKHSRDIIPGSCIRDEKTGKFQVEIRCSWDKCSSTRKVFTSDLFQVKYCEEHQREARNSRRRKPASEKKATESKSAQKKTAAKK